MGTKSVKVKTLADKYGISVKEIVRELTEQGFDASSGSSVIPADLVELVTSHFDELMAARKKGAKDAGKKTGKESTGGKESSSSANEVHVKPPVTVKALAEALGEKPNAVITKLMMMNVLASINQTLDTDIASKVVAEFGKVLSVDKRDLAEHKEEEAEKVLSAKGEFVDDEKDLVPRQPIVTFMGHVDHGKTSLQDAIRKTNVAAGEAGGITQNIGASIARCGKKAITFVDTPGHEAFTAMRLRGANVTDIVVLVVAADDGFMPQTIEALNHARAANVPIIIAINKIDLPDANADKVLLHMQQNGLTPEDWGGNIGVVKVSAKTGQGIDDLLERILLEAEMLELKTNPKRPGTAFVLESQLEAGCGPTANVIVENGTIHLGDPVICGEYYGKIKNIIDHTGARLKQATASMPVKIVGLSGIPEAGCKLEVCRSEKEAKALAEERSASRREETLAGKAGNTGSSLEALFADSENASKPSLKVVVKGDVCGSTEAIVESLKKLPSDKISVEVLHSGIGAITENDVLLAASSGAIVVGFHVRVNPGVNELAKRENVEIRLYSIIYELLEDIKDAMAGKLEPEKREKELGIARILKIFALSKGPKVCGCKVEKGIVKVGSKSRVFRKNVLIFNGEVRSLRRFQDDVKEVREGMECGIRLDNFLDFEEGDTIQFYEIELKKQTL